MLWEGGSSEARVGGRERIEERERERKREREREREREGKTSRGTTARL
jgi:hypothetical protein